MFRQPLTYHKLAGYEDVQKAAGHHMTRARASCMISVGTIPKRQRAFSQPIRLIVLLRVSERWPPHCKMTSKQNIWMVCGRTDSVLDILFIHGLTGTPEDTWTSGPERQYWPKWLCDSLPDLPIYALGYPASMFVRWAKPEANLHERANNMLEQLASYGIGDRPLVIVAHSLGGILAKAMLRASNESSDPGWKRIVTSTRLVAFLSTPHTGAALAGVMKFFIPRLSSTHVSILSNQDGFFDKSKSLIP